MTLKLIGRIGEQDVEQVLPDRAEVYIGRDWKDDKIKVGFLIPISDVSRVHCVVNNYEGNKYSVKDLNSTHGTYVNGEKINQETLLRDGDRLSLASTQFKVRIE